MEIVSFIEDFIAMYLDLFATMQGLIEQIGSDGFDVLSLITGKLPAAIDTVLEHPDFELIYGMMMPIGIAMAALYTALDIMEKTSITEVTLDQLFLTFAKLIAAIALIQNGIEIFQGLNAVSVQITDLLVETLPVGDLSSFTLDSFDSTDVDETVRGFFKVATYILEFMNPLTFPLVIADIFMLLLINIGVPVIAYQRAIKVGYYCLSAPLIFADTAGRGLKTAKATTYLMNLLKLFLEYPLIYFSTYLCLYLQNKNSDFVGLTFVIVLTVCLFRSKEFITNLLD